MYFFREYLDSNIKQLSFADCTKTDITCEPLKPIKIKDNLHFIPSIIDEQQETQYYAVDASIFNSNIEWLKKNYEAIIFDCQSGNTPLFEHLLPKINGTLFVVEPDSVSGRSIHTLVSHTASFMVNSEKKHYVFNKVREEHDRDKMRNDYVIEDIPLKHLKHIMFSWRFMDFYDMSELPEFKNLDAHFSTSIFRLCDVFFPAEEYQDKISVSKKKLLLSKREKLDGNLRSSRKSSLNKIISRIAISTLIAIVALFITLFLIDFERLTESAIIMSIAVVASIVMFGIITAGIYAHKLAHKDDIEKELDAIDQYLL